MVILAAIAAALLAGWAERWHYRRCLRLERLAFSKPDLAKTMLLSASGARVLAVALLASGLAILWRGAPLFTAAGAADPGERDRLIILLDASKSMNLQDAGRNEDYTRADRAREVICDLLAQRSKMPRTSLVPFASTAVPAVVDTVDFGLVNQLLLNVYKSEAYQGEHTNIYAAVERAFSLADEWEDGAATLLMVTDGETDAAKKISALPASIREFVVVGVGSATGRPSGAGGVKISRQEREPLTALAERMGGHYFDGNQEYVPPAGAALLGRPAVRPEKPTEQRRLALGLLGSGAAILAALPLVLLFVGARAMKKVPSAG